MANSSAPEYPASSTLLRFFSHKQTHTLFVLNAYLESKQKWEGPHYHNEVFQWLRSGLATEGELSEWLYRRYFRVPASVHKRRFNDAREQADRWFEAGLSAAAWKTTMPPEGAGLTAACPHLLFCKGQAPVNRQHTAVFNSRKSRLVQPDDLWLRVLRSFLSLSGEEETGLAGSVGTMTYDLVTAYAQSASLPLILILPFPIEEARTIESSSSFPFDAPCATVMTCLSKSMRCSKTTRMVCRDRLLAFLADTHCIVELRSNGNLLSVLKNQQLHQPRRQWIFLPQNPAPHNEGNFRLLEDFPDRTQVLSPADLSTSRPVMVDVRPAYPIIPSQRREIRWKDYLYHYTRSCPGPWPSQTCRDYLLSLLESAPLSGHSALHSLVRILLEGVIRASKRLIRGDRSVVSWTAEPPLEVETIRRWNPALVRWTVDPYGIAVRRKVLMGMGAKPVIYARSEHFSRLKSGDRFRFQHHAPPRTLWKHEREWRLPHDLSLETIASEDGFAFVPAQTDFKHLKRFVAPRLAVVVLSEST